MFARLRLRAASLFACRAEFMSKLALKAKRDKFLPLKLPVFSRVADRDSVSLNHRRYLLSPFDGSIATDNFRNERSAENCDFSRTRFLSIVQSRFPSDVGAFS